MQRHEVLIAGRRRARARRLERQTGENRASYGQLWNTARRKTTIPTAAAKATADATGQSVLPVYHTKFIKQKPRKIQIKKRLNISAKTDLPCSVVSLRQLSYLLSKCVVSLPGESLELALVTLLLERARLQAALGLLLLSRCTCAPTPFSNHNEVDSGLHHLYLACFVNLSPEQRLAETSL